MESKISPDAAEISRPSRPIPAKSRPFGPNFAAEAAAWGFPFRPGRAIMAHRRRLGTALAALLALFLWLEQSWLVTDTLRLRPAGLPPGFDGLRIAVLADLHGRQFGPGGCQLLQAVEQARPELIVLCGDLYGPDTDFDALGQLLRGLCALAPVYSVTGNHEWSFGTVADTEARLRWLREQGVRTLENQSVHLRRGGDAIILLGVHDPNGPLDMLQPDQAVAAARARWGQGFLLVLDHRNTRLALWQRLGAGLVLSGHGHGGLIRLPGIGGLLDAGRTVPARYDAGAYTAGQTCMAVSRGLGGAPRLFNRPQLLLVELQAA